MFSHLDCKCGEQYEVTLADYKEYLRMKAERRPLTLGLCFKCEKCGRDLPFDFSALTQRQIEELC